MVRNTKRETDRRRSTSRDHGRITRLEDTLSIVDSQPRIKTVSFDFMKTLVQWSTTIPERHAEMYRAAQEVFQRNGFDIDAESYQTVRNQVWYQNKLAHKRRGTDFQAIDCLTQIVGQTFMRQKIRVPRDKIRDIAQEIEQGIYRVEKRTVSLMPGTRTTLHGLRERKIPRVVYSNTPFSTEHVRSTLSDLGIERFFDQIIASSDFGLQKSKDSPSGFRKLAWELKQRYGLESARRSILHVGDNRNEDYLGALNAGLRAVHFDFAERSTTDSKRSRTRTSRKNNREGRVNQRENISQLKSSLDQRVSQIIDNSLSEKNKNQVVEKMLERVYHLARDIYGPVLLHYSDNILKSMRGNPKKIAACLGRDGIGAYKVMLKLLETNPKRYEGIMPRQIRYINLSRKVIEKSLQDRGFRHKIGYEGRSDRILPHPKQGDEGYEDYAKLLRRYLVQEGFDWANQIRMIDSGLQGSIQTTIQSIFPEWTKKIKGKYIYNYQRWEDPFRNDKEGYLVQTRSRLPGNRNMKTVHGDSFFLDQTLIYFFEDLFNGFQESNSHLDVRTRGTNQVVVPRTKIGQRASCVNPAKIPYEFKSAQVYQQAKRVIIEGLEDCATIYSAVRQIENGLEQGIFPNDNQARKLLKDYLVGFKDNRLKQKEHQDAVIFETFIRKEGYSSHAEIYDRQWERELRT